MVPGRPSLGQLLRQRGIISQQQLDDAIQRQITTGARLGELLVELGYTTDTQIAEALSEQLELPFLNLEENPPDPNVIPLIPREIALEFRVLPIRREGLRLLVAARDPSNINADEAVRRCVRLPIQFAAAPYDQLDELIDKHYGAEAWASNRWTQNGGNVPSGNSNDSGDSESPQALSSDGPVELVQENEEALPIEVLTAASANVSTIRIVNGLIADAVRRGASDLHIDPAENAIRVRYRVDGVMRPILALPRNLLPSVSARLKVMSGMDIAESRKPQDGGCRVRVDGQNIEIRASMLPGVFGEICVLRLLNSDQGIKSLDRVGMHPEMLAEFRRLLSQRYGMVLVTGPTGSGKSTTLYAGLASVATEAVNVITVEDPVEYKMPGINQVQINAKAGMTFASTLRSMLRQDPDIIMVGEIRDGETAEIAARAALTGHLVISTLHTQSSAATPARLYDMGVAPYIVGASLNGILAQRLVRRVCEACAVPYDIPKGMRMVLETEFGAVPDAEFRRGAGCSKCGNTGMKGRVGIYELLTVDEDMRQLIAEGAPPSQLTQYAYRTGYVTLMEDAYRKSCEGLIAPEEVFAFGVAGMPSQSEAIALIEGADGAERAFELAAVPEVAPNGNGAHPVPAMAG